MKTRTKWFFKNILALSLVGYFSVFSPSLVLAETLQPVSAPVSFPVSFPVSIPVPIPVPSPTPTPTPSPIPVPAAPTMVYPINGQTLDLEGAYMFKVSPVAGASGYLFGLFQDGQMVYENGRDSKTLSLNGEFTLSESNPYHSKFKAGQVQVMIRALVNNQWSNARQINITLKPRPVVSKATITSIWSSPAKFGDGTTIYGSGFGSKTGSVTFINRNNVASGGAPISYWDDSTVKFTVPSVAKGTYQIEITTAAGTKSNRVNFTVTAGQPQIYWLSPATLRSGSYFIIYGSELGNRKGLVNLSNLNSSTPFASTNIYYWSDNMIIGQIPNKIGSNKQYGLQIKTLDNRESSFTFRYISR